MTSVCRRAIRGHDHARVGAGLLVTLLILVATGCAGTDDDANEPLPAMSKEKAESQVRRLAGEMARSARVTLDKRTEMPNVQGCAGRNGEMANDGRFIFDYAVRAPLSIARHPAAIKRVHDALKQRAYEILGYQHLKGDKPSVILDAVNPEHRFNVSVEGHAPQDSLLFSVSTPCLLPPGVKQEKL